MIKRVKVLVIMIILSLIGTVLWIVSGNFVKNSYRSQDVILENAVTEAPDVTVIVEDSTEYLESKSVGDEVLEFAKTSCLNEGYDLKYDAQYIKSHQEVRDTAIEYKKDDEGIEVPMLPGDKPCFEAEGYDLLLVYSYETLRKVADLSKGSYYEGTYSGRDNLMLYFNVDNDDSYNGDYVIIGDVSDHPKMFCKLGGFSQQEKEYFDGLGYIYVAKDGYDLYSY